jgi:NADPH:quinone reductase-like Zn-dependent oxidoreductase
MAYILERLKDGRFKPRIDDHVFAMENAVDACRYMLTGAQAGKIVVQVSE